ncbi:MAG TPA: hypothetical protein VL614_21380 [Acetobacteraceae bacterium]|jgi:hypothetical protein|nr:hypothetical protein [Acetobacteraceae bacterium]
MPNNDAQELRLIARLVVVLLALLVVAGIVWHGISIGVFQRIWHDLVERPEGPLSFRFILQPLMAVVSAILDGLRDARTIRSPFFRALIFEPQHRMARLVEALNAIARIILLGLVMDIIYQVIVFKRFYPVEAVIVALLLAVVPYVVLRGLITRAARRWWHGVQAERT